VRARPIALGVLLVSLAVPSLAAASYDPLGGGQARIALDPGFVSLLGRTGVKLVAKAPAERRGGAIYLPVSGGKTDPVAGKGALELGGALLFRKGARTVPLRRIELQTKKAPLYAKVGGGQLKLAEARSLRTVREGFGLRISAPGLALTQKLATRLDKKLRTPGLFAAGQMLGSAVAKTRPLRVAIAAQGGATLAPDPAFLAKLRSLFVSLNPIAPAELSAGPLLSFPIAPGGALSPDGRQGVLRLGGGIELLQLGAGQVFQREYWLDLGAGQASAEAEIEPTPAFAGKLGRVAVLELDLGAAAISSDPATRTISVSGAVLRLNAQSAQSFNEAFAAGTAAFAAGEQFATVGFEAVGR
jgi:hypothetical protein